ncbi:hypothetical protein MPTK1_6g17380 [Marchantia polymorpha subsp. ruderalis]|uniref:Uncharacterized protein n=2 Tax=Marchantia polymorpha TaxID=3197 RepID=A0AAF6BT09_MARPO|nr:hypothetical protein MARPO_0184s0012 [Marchantia polymorpha]BBN15143.1 hypothetical protein Mp_6g17380 [Marchantia polymorpha subsp. ruderalis]|eukprot:PTQ27769.1 hypothetical protein MARPO_0184s0012 [Marchantia polymorpha]
MAGDLFSRGAQLMRWCHGSHLLVQEHMLSCLSCPSRLERLRSDRGQFHVSAIHSMALLRAISPIDTSSRLFCCNQNRRGWFEDMIKFCRIPERNVSRKDSVPSPGPAPSLGPTSPQLEETRSHGDGLQPLWMPN